MKVRSIGPISKSPFSLLFCQRAQELLKEEEDDDASFDGDDMEVDRQEPGEARPRGKKTIPPVPQLPKVNGSDI